MNYIIWMIVAVLPFLSLFRGQEGIGKVEKAFEVGINDSTSIQIDLQYNDNDLPEHYVSHIETPVCKDGLCYLMVIDITWDILGNFLKYEVPENLPLTKFDHVEFTEDDHIKMREVLSNRDSFLRFYALENLIDTTEHKSSTVADGVSGATHKSIQNEVVGGAVFSTYVLWHIVNGTVATKILTHTEDRLNDALLVQMLESKNYHYQYYALDKIKEEDITEYLPQIIRLVSDGVAYVPYFAIEKIPKKVWEASKSQIELISLLVEVDFEMQNELLNRVKGVSLDPEAIDALISSIGKLRESQIIKALEIMEDNKGRINDKSLPLIQDLTKHSNTEIATWADRIIQAKNNKNI